MAITADLSVAHQCTLAWGALPAVTRTYTSNFSAGTDGWSAGAAGTAVGWTANNSISLAVTSTATGYAKKTITVGAPLIALRVRVMVALADPTARPVKVWIQDQLGNGGSQAAARFVGASPVEVMQDLPNGTSTELRIFTAKATGAADATLIVTSVITDRVPSSLGQDWSIVRTDVNGTKKVGDWITTQANSSGVATIVDRDAALFGSVTWNGPSGSTITRTLTSTGYAVIAGPSGSILDGTLMSYRLRRAGSNTAHRIINRADPLVALAPAAARSGTIVLRVADATAADDLTDLLGSAVVLWLRVPDRPRIDCWFTLDDVEVSPVLLELPAPLWEVTISLTEVARPTS